MRVNKSHAHIFIFNNDGRNMIVVLIMSIILAKGQESECTPEVQNVARQSGILQSPQYPQNYAANTICRWRLGNVKGAYDFRFFFVYLHTRAWVKPSYAHTPLDTVGTIIRVNFIVIDIELDAACRWDFVQFTTPGESPDKHCGSDLPDLLRFLMNKTHLSINNLKVTAAPY